MESRTHPLAVRWFLGLIACLFLTGPILGQNCVNTVWCDDFTGVAGAAPDPTKWTYDHGNLNVNNELEFYCSFGDSTSPCDPTKPNAIQDGSGNLVIQANRITTNQAPGSNAWTSARLITKNLATFTYGRVEARMKFPVAPGLWPAFWALGSNIDSVGWPNCGEIDFMENVPAASGLGPTKIRSTIHGPGYSGASGLGNNFTFPNGGQVDTAFHIYGAIWSPSMVQFYVDDPANVFFVKTASDVPGGPGKWAYNHPFYLLANLAVGGTGSWPGAPDGTTASPAVMLVDYVRVFQNPAVPGPNMTASPITVKAGIPGNTTLNLTGSSTNDGRVYLACSTTAPQATCSISTGGMLNSFVVDFSSGTSKTATVTVATTANAMLFPPSFELGDRYWGPIGFATLTLLLMTLFAIWVKARTGRWGYVLAVVLIMAGGGIAACSGGSSNAAPPPNGGTLPGSYTVTVNAYTTSGNGTTPSSTVNIPLTVN